MAAIAQPGSVSADSRIAGVDAAAAGNPAASDPAAAPRAALLRHVESTLAVLAPCSAAVLVSRQGELLVEEYLRGEEPQNPAAPTPGPDSLWPWWSVTKSVSAALVARLVQEGGFSLDSPLSTFLPEFGSPGLGPFDRRNVLVRHLLCHTSGCAVPGRVENGVDLGPEPPLDKIAVLSAPGSRFEYSSLGMNLLERFIEASTGEDYGTVLAREVLVPLGIPDVGFLSPTDMAAVGETLTAPPDGTRAAEAERAPRAARASRAASGRLSRALPCLDGRIVPSQPRQRCGLGLYGTARDLLTFGEAWLTMKDCSGSPWLTPDQRGEFWKHHSTRPSDGSDYGLLWWLFDDLGGRVASGASYSLCALIPEKGIAAVVARNHFGPGKAAFDYRAEKRRILELAGALAP